MGSWFIGEADFLDDTVVASIVDKVVVNLDLIGRAGDFQQQGIAAAHCPDRRRGHTSFELNAVEVAHRGIVIDDDVLPITDPEKIGIVARSVVVAIPGVVATACKGVVARATVEDVVVGAALQYIITRIAVDLIVA